MTPHESFITDTVRILLEKQTARAGGQPDGALCLTVTEALNRPWTSLGRWLGDRYELVAVPGGTLEPEPCRLDLNSWPALDLLTDLTGESQYRRMLREMVAVVVRHGFHPRSGLFCIGSMTQFDVLRLQPAGVGAWKDKPSFKLDSFMASKYLWEAAPQQMGRCFKAAYYGMITRPATMDFNRYCSFDWDDSLKKHVTPFHPGHVGFASSAAWLIQYWGMIFARTGDRECLTWAGAMADKWRAVQHPKTGLVPHFFGRVDPDDPAMSPRPYIHVHDCHTAVTFLEAAREFRARPDGENLADQLRDMGLKILRGIAREGYAAAERIFYPWIKLEGGEYTENAFYTFRTPAQKDAALKRDPNVKDVAVFRGYGFYDGLPWNLCTGNSIIPAFARGAELANDAGLLDTTCQLMRDALKDAEALTSEVTQAGQWTFTANASYIKTLLLLANLTGEPSHLDHAGRLADKEIRLLSRPTTAGQPEWWRIPGRNALLESLLRLDLRLRSPSSASPP